MSVAMVCAVTVLGVDIASLSSYWDGNSPAEAGLSCCDVYRTVV